MKIDNKISPFLTGPYIFFGIIFIPGIIWGIWGSHWFRFGISLSAACYLFFTYSGVEIDTNNRKFRAYNRHFGLFRTGRWRALDDYIGLTLVPMKTVYKMFSRSNRVNSSEKDEYRIYLVNKAKKPAIEIKKCKTPEKGQDSLDELAIWLHFPVFSVKH